MALVRRQAATHEPDAGIGHDVPLTGRATAAHQPLLRLPQGNTEMKSLISSLVNKKVALPVMLTAAMLSRW